MANVNQVSIGGEMRINLTQDTVTPADLAEGVTAHDASGALIVGEAPKVDITQYYTKAEVDELIAKAITDAMGTNGGGYFWKSVKEE